MTRPARIVSVDPGEEHVGVCVFVSTESFPDWTCTEAREFDRPGFYEYLPQLLRLGVDVLVYETWQIYPDKAALLTGSKCETAECIGVLKYLATHVSGDWPSVTPPAVVEQPASIQIPTRSVLKSRGMKSTAIRLKAGGHALSAELHGWHYLMRTGLV
jgi:hypothetical protein